ncbi:hypothetical protein GEMRC1_008450 [Eukaryota sp. GEM-RC1]
MVIEPLLDHTVKIVPTRGEVSGFSLVPNGKYLLVGSGDNATVLKSVFEDSTLQSFGPMPHHIGFDRLVPTDFVYSICSCPTDPNFPCIWNLQVYLWYFESTT